MNTKELKEFFSHKTWLWKRIFGNFYLAHYDPSLQQLRNSREEDMMKFFIFYRNENDVEKFWNVVKEVDRQEEELTSAIEDLRFCRPISWQYDFVKTVSERLKINLLEKLEFYSVVDAYCLAKVNGIDTAQLIADLDDKYSMIFASAAHKTDLLRRNFSLLLETMAPRRFNGNCAGLNFREIAERYVSCFGVKGLVETLKKARTPETKLTQDEAEVMTLAYYSLYSCNKVKDISPQVPGTNIAECVAARLAEEKEYLEKLRALAGRYKNDDEDDENDEIREILSLKHSPIYLDPTEFCLIDVQRTTPLYAHVYIEKFPQNDLNNSLPDFIQYKKGCLFTVEFVEDLKKLEVAEDLNKKLNAIKQEMIRLDKACLDDPSLSLNFMFRRKYASLKDWLSTCFYIC